MRRVVLVSFLVLAFLSARFVILLWQNLPDVTFLNIENPQDTALMKECGGTRQLAWMALADLSPRLPQAVLMGEDSGGMSRRMLNLNLG